MTDRRARRQRPSERRCPRGEPADRAGRPAALLPGAATILPRNGLAGERGLQVFSNFGMHREHCTRSRVSDREPRVNAGPLSEARERGPVASPLVNPPDVPDALARIEAELTAPGGMFEIVEDTVLGEQMAVFANRLRSLRDAVVSSTGFGDAEYLIFSDGDARRVITFRRARARGRVGRGRAARPVRRRPRRPGRDPRRELPGVDRHVLGDGEPRGDRGRPERLVGGAGDSLRDRRLRARRCSSPTPSAWPGSRARTPASPRS